MRQFFQTLEKYENKCVNLSKNCKHEKPDTEVLTPCTDRKLEFHLKRTISDVIEERYGF